MGSQIGWFIGLIVSVLGALVGQAELLPEPWRHYATVLFVGSTAINGYMLQRPRRKWSDEERQAKLDDRE